MPAKERPPLGFDPIAEAARQWRAHGWEGSARAMTVVTSIMRVQQLLVARADAALRSHGLTFARYEVLMLLWFSRRGELPLGTIGRRLQVNPASVTNAIDRLQVKGLVERVPNPTDGRGTLARLTSSGRSSAEAATESVNTAVFSDLGVSQESLDVLFELLRDMRRASGDFDDAPLAPGRLSPPATGDGDGATGR